MFDDDEEDEETEALASPPLTEIRIANFVSYIDRGEREFGAINAEVGNKNIDAMKEYEMNNIFDKGYHSRLILSLSGFADLMYCIRLWWLMVLQNQSI
jgi:hypothetical protein